MGSNLQKMSVPDGFTLPANQKLQAPAVLKRPANDSSALLPLLKKPRAENALVRATSDKAKQLAKAAPTRTSSLAAPIICLEGSHTDELYCGKFHPKGTAFVSSGADRMINFW